MTNILKSHRGFTLVEVVCAVAISGLLFGSLMSSYMAIKSINAVARSQMQATQAVRRQIETMKVTPFANLANSATNVSLGAGADGIFNNADDPQGAMTVTLQDFLDMDNDGNTAENLIDVDNDGTNDATARPVRVSISWVQHSINADRAQTVFADTLIAS